MPKLTLANFSCVLPQFPVKLTLTIKAKIQKWTNVACTNRKTSLHLFFPSLKLFCTQRKSLMSRNRATGYFLQVILQPGKNKTHATFFILHHFLLLSTIFIFFAPFHFNNKRWISKKIKLLIKVFQLKLKVFRSFFSSVILTDSFSAIISRNEKKIQMRKIQMIWKLENFYQFILLCSKRKFIFHPQTLRSTYSKHFLIKNHSTHCYQQIKPLRIEFAEIFLRR